MKKASYGLLILLTFVYLYCANFKDMTNIEEIWKDVVGYDGFYQVSSNGRIKNTKTNYIKVPIKNWAGYHRIQLCKNKKCKIFSIHRLVALAFLPNPNGLPEINHIDHIRSNNSLSNLEWCSRSYNAQYSFLRPDRKKSMAWLGKSGILHPNSKPIIQKHNGIIVNKFDSISDASRVLSIKASSISRVCTGERKRYKGFNWEFV